MKKSILQLLRWHAPTMVIVVALLAAITLFLTRPDSVKLTRPDRSWNVEVRTVETATLRPTLELFGQVESSQDALLSAGVEGAVLAVMVREGERVSAGQLLVEIDAREAGLTLRQRNAELGDIRAQLELAQRRVSRTEQVLERQRELTAIASANNARAREIFSDGVISQADLDVATENLKRQQLALTQQELAIEESRLTVVQLESQVARAEALRDQAALVVERTRIVAPFSGVIADVSVSVGDRLRPGDAVLQLYDPGAQEVRAQVPSRYLETLLAGLNAGLDIPANVDFTGGRAVASLSRISGQTRTGAGGVDAFFELAGGNPALRRGTTVRVLIQLPPQTGVFGLPAEALYGQGRVYKMVDGRMRSVAVERVGERVFEDGRSEVIVRSPELANGDQVIVTKLSNAADGIAVTVPVEGKGALVAGGESGPGDSAGAN